MYLSVPLRLLQTFAVNVLTLGSIRSPHLHLLSICVRVHACVTGNFLSYVDLASPSVVVITFWLLLSTLGGTLPKYEQTQCEL